MEKFEEISQFGQKVQKFAEEIQGIMIRNNDSLDGRLQIIEQAGVGGGKGEGKRAYELKPTVFIKATDQLPGKMDDDVSMWREWKDNFLSYSDTLRPGMKE